MIFRMDLRQSTVLILRFLERLYSVEFLTMTYVSVEYLLSSQICHLLIQLQAKLVIRQDMHVLQDTIQQLVNGHWQQQQWQLMDGNSRFSIQLMTMMIYLQKLMHITVRQDTRLHGNFLLTQKRLTVILTSHFQLLHLI